MGCAGWSWRCGLVVVVIGVWLRLWLWLELRLWLCGISSPWTTAVTTNHHNHNEPPQPHPTTTFKFHYSPLTFVIDFSKCVIRRAYGIWPVLWKSNISNNVCVLYSSLAHCILEILLLLGTLIVAHVLIQDTWHWYSYSWMCGLVDVVVAVWILAAVVLVFWVAGVVGVAVVVVCHLNWNQPPQLQHATTSTTNHHGHNRPPQPLRTTTAATKNQIHNEPPQPQLTTTTTTNHHIQIPFVINRVYSSIKIIITFQRMKQSYCAIYFNHI